MTENQRKWIDALRSGKYTQTTHVLRRPDNHGNGFCCLGVLCDISGGGEWDNPAKPRDADQGVPFRDSNEATGLFVIDGLEAVNEFIDLYPGDYTKPRTSGGYYDSAVIAEAMRRNDDGESFEEIAEWLESDVWAEEEVVA